MDTYDWFNLFELFLKERRAYLKYLDIIYPLTLKDIVYNKAIPPKDYISLIKYPKEYIGFWIDLNREWRQLIS